MVKKSSFRGFTEEGFLLETLRITIFGIPIYQRQCVDSLVTAQACDEESVGIGFSEETNNLEDND